MTAISGSLPLYVPAIPYAGGLQMPSFADLTLDAAGETIHILGRVFLNGRPASAKTVTTGGSGLRWLPGGSITFANAGTALNVGLQTINTTTGPAGRASSSTPAIYKALVGGTDTITANTWRTDSFGTGSISSIAHGDKLAILFNMSARGGADSVLYRSLTSATGGQMHMPLTTLETGGTYTPQAQVPNCIIVTDDGTLGWLDGSLVTTAISSNAIGTGSAVKEYANIFQLPFDCKVDGIWWQAHNDASGTANWSAALYSDPLASGAGPTSMEAVAEDANTLGTSTVGRFFFAPFTAEQSISANTDYAVALRPTAAATVTIPYWSVNAAAEWAPHGLGTACYAASRGTVAAGTAFASISSGVQRIWCGVRISDVVSGGGGGMLRHPGMAGGVHG